MRLLVLLLVLANVHGKRARIKVEGEVAAKQEKQVVQLVEAIVSDVEKRFTQPTKTADPTVTLQLFATADRYREEAAKLGEPIPSDWGFYRPDKRLALANLEAGIGNLRHELVHPLLGDDFPGIPSWLNEGIAALYGSSKLGKHGFTFVVNYRLRDLQRALKAGTLPSLHDLATSSFEEFHGERAMVYYAYARYVLLYLDRKGKLSALYADLRAADPAKQAEVLASYVDEKDFRRWAKSLRY